MKNALQTIRQAHRFFVDHSASVAEYPAKWFAAYVLFMTEIVKEQIFNR